MANPRKPTKIRQLEGMRGHASPLPKDEPMPIGQPSVPRHLAPDALARWWDIVSSLPEELLTRADDATLERAAKAWATYREACAKLDAGGLVIEGPNGPIPNPVYVIVRHSSADLDRCSWELGLSPAA